MTYEEALKELKHEIDMLPKEPPSDFVVNENVWLKEHEKIIDAHNKAIEALEKQIPKKPKMDNDNGTVCKYNDGVNEWCKGSCPEFINDNQVLNNPSISNIPLKAVWIHSADGIYCSHCWNKLGVTGIPQICPYCYSQMTDNGWEMR